MNAATATLICDSLSALIGFGAKIIPVVRRDKRPAGNHWPLLATDDCDQIADWLQRGNVGISLGHGNLIDVEYDDDAGCEMFQALETSSGESLSEIRTPCWSSQRGMHHLFRLADELPTKGWVKRGGLEIRLGGKPAQSVLPPSIHPSGRRYEWLISPCDCEPAIITLSDLGIV